MKTARSGSVTELEFTQYMLLAMGKVEQHTLDAIHSQFNDLDVLAKGYIDEATLAAVKQRGERNSLLWLPEEALLSAHDFDLYGSDAGPDTREHVTYGVGIDGEEGSVLLHKGRASPVTASF